MSTIDTSLLKPELVFFDFEASDRADFFRRLGDELMARGYVRKTWLQGILDRERDYPTGLACVAVSVALPHVDPEHLIEPYIAIVRPAHPIEFDGMAGTGLVNADLIINLGIKAHAEDQVAVLQAFLNIFIDEQATADIMSQDTPWGMVEAVKRYCT